MAQWDPAPDGLRSGKLHWQLPIRSCHPRSIPPQLCPEGPLGSKTVVPLQDEPRSKDFAMFPGRAVGKNGATKSSPLFKGRCELYHAPHDCSLQHLQLIRLVGKLSVNCAANMWYVAISCQEGCKSHNLHVSEISVLTEPHIFQLDLMPVAVEYPLPGEVRNTPAPCTSVHGSPRPTLTDLAWWACNLVAWFLTLGVSINGGYPLKWMIWGYPYFRKPPYQRSAPCNLLPWYGYA